MNFQATITQSLPEESINWLKNRFFSLCDDEKIWNEINENYNEKQRTYHNLSHIYSLFQLLDKAGFTNNNPILEWSIWYHDIIYDSKRKDNEKQSAILFQKSCSAFLESELVEAVSTVIESTEKHFPLSEAKEVKWMLDLDLFILCSPASIYESYSKAIRQEYKWVPGFMYKKGRKKVLRSFLDRERIYFSDYFYASYEEIARTNLANELKQL